jgi:hypothetical protein
MSVPPKTSVELRDFPGIMPQSDPRDLPPGAAEEQVNAQSIRTGELNVRPGYRVVTFEEN